MLICDQRMYCVDIDHLLEEQEFLENKRKDAKSTHSRRMA